MKVNPGPGPADYDTAKGLQRRQSHWGDILQQQRAEQRGNRKQHGMSYKNRSLRSALKELWIDAFKVLVSWRWPAVLLAFLLVLVSLATLGALCLLPLYHDGAVRLEGGGQYHFNGLVLMSFSNLVALGCEWGVPTSRGAQLVVAALNLMGVVTTTFLIGVVVTKFTHKPHGLVFSTQLLVGAHHGDAVCLRMRVANSSGGTVLQPTLKMVALLEDAEHRAARAANPAIFVGARKVVVVEPEAPVSDYAYMPAVLYINHVCSGASPFAPREYPPRPADAEDRNEGGGAERFCIDDLKVLMVSMMGTDSVTGLPVFGTKAYTKHSIKEGYAFVDCMSANGAVDLQLFDTIKSTTQELRVEDCGEAL